MTRRIICTALLWLLTMTGQTAVAADALSQREEVRQFIDSMVDRYKFTRDELIALLDQVQPRSDIIEAITKPAESKPWYVYRPIFINPERIQGGVEFWKTYKDTLERAEQVYGVPPQIIVAILGVETRYGKHSGKYRVIDALATLAFDYPARGKFFTGELEQYLLLAREEKIDPLSLTGSYAGAMGPPQFMPSSYRTFAVDFDGDGKRDLLNNMSDAIGSIANYLSINGWKRGQPVVFPAQVSGTDYKLMANKEIKPLYTMKEMTGAGIKPDGELPPTALAMLLELEGASANEYWVGLQNFYVITRYNRSPLYALAVFQLGEQIRALYNNTVVLTKP